MNYNQLLGTTSQSNEQDIQRAFRKAALDIHPDHNNAPEAAEAFANIKEARDRLLEEARRAGPSRDDAVIRSATAAAVKASDAATHSSGSSFQPTSDDVITPEELAHIQELDRLALRYRGKFRFKRSAESEEVRKHRKKIETTTRRIDGKY